MPWIVERWTGIAGLVQSFGDRRTEAPDGVTTLRQVHGRAVFDVVEVTDQTVEGDGIVTDRPGSRVGVWTADCVPIHLVSPSRRVVAAVHSGWRGTAAGVVEAALERMRRQCGVSPAETEAALGPAIGGCCYEVGAEVRDAFVARYGTGGEAGFESRGGGLYLDLRTFLERRLRELGVAVVERVGPCTSCRTDLLYSYRREGTTGRQLSYVGWTAG